MHDSTHHKEMVLANRRLLGRSEEPSARSSDPLMLAMYSMDEPWRRRFLMLVARVATHRDWEGEEPTPAEIGAWLNTQPRLRRYLRLLLNRWINKV